MNKKLTWSTESRKVSELTPYDKNPRTLSDKQRMDLETSLTKFGLVEIPAINTDNTLISGHQRLKILLLLGKADEFIDVRVPNRKLTDQEFEEYLLRANRNSGSWNYEMLKEFDTEFLLDIGFSDTDLEDIWDDVLEIEDDPVDEAKEVDIAKQTQIQEGDMFRLGNSYLICGDSTNPEVITKLVGDAKMNVILQDSPYNIGYDYNKGQGKSNKYGADVEDARSDEDFYQFIRVVTKNCIAVGKTDMHVFSYCDQSYVGMLQNMYKDLNVHYKRTCLWIKNGFNPTPQVAFNKGYEPCVYGTIGKPYLSDDAKLTEVMNKDIASGNATIDNILDYFDIWLARRDAGEDYEHSTQKPLSLHEKPLRRCTKIGDNVIDPFGGSGSTLLACEQLKRNAYLVEKEPVFCQVIINRFERITGKYAEEIN